MRPRPIHLAFALALAIPSAACALAPQQRGRLDTAHSMGTQEVKWFHSGWYGGATVGAAMSNASGSDIDRDLAARGYTTNTSVDDTDLGWKLFGGYRFDEPWAVELAVVDLGLIDSSIETDAADIDAFLASVADVHPYSGAGLSLTGTYYPIQKERFDLGVKAGLWFWDADVDAEAATGESANIDESGVDPLIGVVGLVDLGKNFSARLEWEHYFIDETDVDFLALGIQYTVRQ